MRHFIRLSTRMTPFTRPSISPVATSRIAFLPDKAIDVLDEAGSRVKLQNTVAPEEVIKAQRKIKVIVRQMSNAISAKEFDRAAKLNEQEQKESENLQGDEGALETPKPGSPSSDSRARGTGDLPLDRNPRHFPQGRGNAEVAANGNGAASPNH